MTTSMSAAWAMMPNAFEEFRAIVEGRHAPLKGAESFSAYLDEHDDGDRSPGFELRGNVAVVPIRGVVLEHRSPLLSFLRVDHVSTVELAELVENLRTDDRVAGVVFDVNSPGGQICGLTDASDAIRELSREKPTVAHASGCMGSAAYWLGSQATRVTASRLASVGAIGVFRHVLDSSRLYETKGLKRHVITSHELKGIGVLGARVTDAQIESMQAAVSALFREFVSDVAQGRAQDLDAVEAYATGETFFGSAAIELGLIDQVSSLALEIEGISGAAQPAGEPRAEQEEGPVGNPEEQPAAPAGEESAKRLAELERENAQLRAAAETAAKEKELASSALEAHHRGEKAKAIASAQREGRVAPAQLEEVELYASMLGDDSEGVDRLKSFLGAMPVIVSPERESSDAGQKTGGVSLSPEEQSLCASLGISEELYRDVSEAEEIGFDGSLFMADGSVKKVGG